MKRKIFFIELFLFLSVSISMFAQVGGPQNNTLSIPKTLEANTSYVNYPANGTTLYLHNFGIQILQCGFDFSNYTLEVEASLNEVNGVNITSLSTNYTPSCIFDIKPTIFDVNGTSSNLYFFNTMPNLPGGSNQIHIELTKEKPKAFYHLDINSTTYDFLNSATINSLLFGTAAYDGALRFPILNFSSSQVDFNNLKLKYRIVPKKADAFSPFSGFTFSPSAIQNISTSKVDFTLDVCNNDANKPIIYQLQLLKLYNEDPTKTSENDIAYDPKKIDWKKALNIYTSNQNPSLTIAEGSGYYLWRYRRIIPKNSSSEADPFNWDSWYENTALTITNPSSTLNQLNAITQNVFYYTQFDNTKNWIYSRNLIEGEAALDMKQNLIGEGMIYANGLGMVRQHQGFSNSNNEVVVSNEMQDFVGRSVLKTLSCNVGQNHLGYVQGFTGTYSVNDFDANSNYNNTSSMSNSILTDFYSNNNSDVDIPSAEGFPFTRTLLGRNSQNEVIESSMPGATHKINNSSSTTSHTIKMMIGSVADIELVRIFGDEAPSDTNVLKKISIDPNNEISITYVDKTGKTLATCMSVNPSELLKELPSKASSSFEIKQKVNLNTQDNNSITASKSLVFEKGGIVLNMDYKLNEKSYQDLCANLCSTCDYKMTFTLVNQDDPNTILWQGESKINPAMLPCSSLTNTLHAVPIYQVGTTTLALPYTILSAGKYLISKKVELFNTNTSNKKFIDANTEQLETYLRSIYLDPTLTNKNWEVWNGANNTPIVVGGSTLKVNLLELRNKLESKQMKSEGGVIGVYEMLSVDPTNENVNTRILKFNDPTNATCATEFSFKIQACKQIDCSDVNAFVNQLFTELHTKLNSTDLNVNNGTLSHFPNGFDDIFRLNSTLLSSGIGTGGGYSTISTSSILDKYIKLGETGMKRIMTNMLTDPDVYITQSSGNKLMKYSCDEITKAFYAATSSLIEFYSPSAVQFRADNGLVMEPDFLDDFLQSAGYKFTCGTNKIGNPNTALDKGFATTPYRCFKYIDNNSDLFNWATLNSSYTGLSAACATILYFNNYYNGNLPTGCSLIPSNDPNNVSGNTAIKCFNPNLSYFSSNTSLTIPTLCPVHEIPAEMLVMAYKGLKNGNNSSITSGGSITLPNPQNLNDMQQFALDMEFNCIKNCNERYNEISNDVNEALINSNIGVSGIEGYKNTPYGTFGNSNSNVFSINWRDNFVVGIIDNCKSKCKVDVVPFISNGYQLYKLDENDIVEYNKALLWDIEIRRKPIPDGGAPFNKCQSCLDIISTGTSYSLSPTTCPTTSAISVMSNLDLMYSIYPNLNYQLMGRNNYFACCNDAYSTPGLDLTKYPLEDADYKVPKEFAKVYRPNPDFWSSTLNNMLPFLEKRISNKIINGATSYNVYYDIVNYLSPVQGSPNGGGYGYTEIPLYSNTSPNNNQIETDALQTNPVKTLVLGNNPSDISFTLGKPIKTIETTTHYIIERETTDILPFHAEMPVKVKIYRNPSSTVSLTGTQTREVEYEEKLLNHALGSIDISSPDGTAPAISFDGNLSQLKFKHTFNASNQNKVFEFTYNIRVHHDLNNATNLTKKLSNQDIIDAKNNTPITCVSSNYSNGKLIKYSNVSFKVNGTPHTFSMSTNLCGTTNYNYVFIPFLRPYSQTASPNSVVPSANSAIDYVIGSTLSQPPTTFTSTPVYIPNTTIVDYYVTTANLAESANDQIYNENVQVVPLYYNYTENGVQQHVKVMDLNNLKMFWHDYFCLQWHPYAPISENELDPEIPVTCADAEALEVLDLINAGINDIIDKRKLNLNKQYNTQCVAASSLNDDFTVTYNVGYHHYTLYYYDRAGNLVRTVPPEGVDILPITATRADHPNHRLVTEYNYNSLNGITSQNTPDGGNTKFWYDNLGRIRFSQNAKQATSNLYSFSTYDNLGRITMVGQISSNLTTINAQLNTPSWPSVGSVTMTDVVTTVYNNPYYLPGYPTFSAIYCNSNQPQRNLLNRVSYTIADADGLANTINDRTINYYSYDIHGNVEWVGTKIADLPTGFIRYEYDLISGSVVKVIVNECDNDAFFHKYVYDTDKRLQKVFTSRDGYLWDNDATYNYYKHGPLRSVTVGQDKVQQIDYGYTIMGWLKGINHLSKNNAMTTAPNSASIAVPDLYATKLHYFDGDFNRTFGGIASAYNTYNVGTDYNIVGSMDNIYGGKNALGVDVKGGLYNGNIRGIYTAITNPLPDANTTANNRDQLFAHAYEYDELNRLTQTAFYGANTPTSKQLVAGGNQYKEQFEYDANGNIKTLKRYDGEANLFDDFTYNYALNANGKIINNKLNQVTEIANSSSSMAPDYDIKPGQISANYVYDAIGNMIEDKQEKLVVSWNNFGKVSEINKDNKTKIIYLYDAMGNRVAKNIYTRATSSVAYPLYPETQEFYLRDASGNIMSNYLRKNTYLAQTNSWQTSTQLTEQPIYGSDRIGVYKNVEIYKTNNFDNPLFINLSLINTLKSRRQLCYRTLNLKRYELKDHLGNVHTNFSDMLLAKNYIPNAGTLNYSTTFAYTNGLIAHQTSLYNYYSFGMPKPNHTVGTLASATNWLDEQDNNYRYGFNGQMKSDEISGIGNHNTATYWEYDTRLGRRWNLDPKPNPSISNYATFENNPIWFSDLCGDTSLLIIWTPENGNVGHSLLAIQNYKEVISFINENGKVVVKKTMVPDGTYTVMDFWPSEKVNKFTKKMDSGAEGYNPHANNKYTLDELKNTDITEEEGKKPDAVLQIQTNYAKDQEIKTKMLIYALIGKEYNTIENNCTDYVKCGVENAFGKNISGKENISGYDITTPIGLYKETKLQKNVKVIHEEKEKIKKGTANQL